ncbi:unnamed protein product [Ectocarpus sp. 12 AP-2014]
MNSSSSSTLTTLWRQEDRPSIQSVTHSSLRGVQLEVREAGGHPEQRHDCHADPCCSSYWPACTLQEIEGEGPTSKMNKNMVDNMQFKCVRVSNCGWAGCL